VIEKNAVSGDDDDDDDEESDDADDEVQAVKSQQKAAQFGWFDDLFVFDTGWYLSSYLEIHNNLQSIILFYMHNMNLEIRRLF